MLLSFTLEAFTGVGIRPAVSGASESVHDAAAINMTDDVWAGSAVFYWNGNLEDISIRVVQASTAATGERYESAYLAPAAATF